MKELLKKLVQADSTSEKGEAAVAEIIAAQFAESGIKSRIDKWDSIRANIITHIKSAGQRPALLFACHLDVVPPGEVKWKTAPFSGAQNKGRILGRGSTDMKGGTTAIVTAIRQIIDSGTKLKGDIIFFGAAGEETDSCGAKRFMRNMPRMPKLAGVIVPEPTGFDIVTAHRGLLWLKITTKGRTAHGSTPELGINAISLMAALLNELEDYRQNKLSKECSMSVNTISGGKAVNVIPDHCEICVDFRLTVRQNSKKIISDVEKIFKKIKRKNKQFNAQVSVARNSGALETDNYSAFVKDFCKAVAINKTTAVGFSTDGPYFVPLGVPIVIFGPGKVELCHKPDEYIDIADVEKGVEYYKKIILKFLT